MSYAPYPAYKDSGVPWLGQIPEGWEPKKIKYVVNYIGSGKTPRGGAEIYTDDGIMILRSQNVYDDGLRLKDVAYVTPEVEALQINTRVRPEDVLLNITGASIGRSSIVPGDLPTANVNQHVCIFRPQKTKIDPKFLHAFFCSSIGKEQVTSNENGTSREGLNFQQAGNLHLVLPPLGKQSAIADFLDNKTAEIDDLIAKKEELLRLLAEQRTALITHAVTKGLNPNAPMKPSGIDWLGDVPEGWEIRPISTAIQKLESGVSVNAMDVPAEVDQQGVLKTSAVYSGSFDPTQNKLIYDPVEAERLACPVRKGELIISRMNTPDLVGAVGIVEDEYPNLFLPDRLWQTRFWKQATANAPFLYYFLSSKLFRAVIASLASGTSGSMQNITQSDLMKIKIGMPPLSEQSQIVGHLDQALEKLDATREKTYEAIKKLREYRTALITNAVTGKIKVA
jgi:type I restriction enzyme S subunit